MKVEQIDDDSFQLSGYVDLSNLMAWRTELEERLPSNGSTRIDLSALDFNGSAILALMVFLTRRARVTDGDVQFLQVSERLNQMTELADLSGLLAFK